VKGFTWDTERIEALRRGDRHHDVGVGQEVALGVVDGDDALADVAGAVGDDGGRSDADMPVPGLGGLCVPGDLYCLPDGELADLGLVEVGVDLDFVEIGDSDQSFAGGNEIVGGDGDGIDGTGLRGPDIVASVAALCGDERCPGIGDLRFEQRPTGAKDPFGLRRAALGVLRILLEGRLDLDLFELLAEAAAAQPVLKAGVADEVYEYLFERLRGLLSEEPGTTVEMLDAVFANRPRSPLDALARLQALKEFLSMPEAVVLAAINKRIANILKKTTPGSQVTVDAGALTEEAERNLHRTLSELRAPVEEAAAERRYAQSLKALVALRAPVDEFFERVMVMDEDIGRRNNRLALLREVQRLLGGVADLSRLPG